ncbi:MAG: calcium-binding protein, partial [Cyanobacteria bacterium P01_D01_bin.123]
NVQDLSATDIKAVAFSGGEGDDLLDASQSEVEVTADGGAGNDILLGGDSRDITDTLMGGEGHDIIVGNKGADLKIGGDGRDLLIWNNGDGSDTMEGGSGGDVVEVNGALEDGDDFRLEANGDRVAFERQNLGLFELDVNDVERFAVNGGGGNDTLTVGDLAGTDVSKVVFSGGDGDDLFDASASTQRLHAYGDAGNDTLLGGAAKDWLNGGDGNDYLQGGDSTDILFGHEGNDTLVGDTGNDLKIAGSGDDRLIWNNGDGSDFMLGGRGYDVVEVNGADAAGDKFVLQANGRRTVFTRQNLGFFQLNIDDVERFEINGGGGNDTLTVKDLEATDVEIVAFSGGEGDDLFDASQTTTPLSVFGDAGNDTLLGGLDNDEIDGGAGNDFIAGGGGNDTLMGGAGDDTLIGGAVGDMAIGTIDILSGGAGGDRFALANEMATYYNDGDPATAGVEDYAQVMDFSKAEDVIQLNGSAADYVLGTSDGNTSIYMDTNGNGAFDSTDELIAQVMGHNDLDLSANYFDYI